MAGSLETMTPDRDALALIAAAHLELRVALAEIDALATAAAPDRARAARVAETLCARLARHVLDEEGALFPLLLDRASPEDGLDETLAALSREHKALSAATEAAAGSLIRMSCGAATAADREALRDFCAVKRRHLMLENAVVLPLARTRLTRADRAAMAGRMQRRRD